MPQLIALLLFLFLGVFVLVSAFTYAAGWISGLVAALITHVAMRESVRTSLMQSDRLAECCALSVTSAGLAMYIRDDRVRAHVSSQSPVRSVHTIGIFVTVLALVVVTLIFDPFNSADASAPFVAVTGWIASLIIVPAITNQFCSGAHFERHALTILRDQQRIIANTSPRYSQILETIRQADDTARSIAVGLEPSTLARLERGLTQKLPAICSNPETASAILEVAAGEAAVDLRHLREAARQLSELSSRVEQALDLLYTSFNLTLKQKVDKIVEGAEDAKQQMLRPRRWREFGEFISGLIDILDRDIKIARQQQSAGEARVAADDAFSVLDIDPGTPLDRINISQLRKAFNMIYHPDKSTRNVEKIQRINAALDDLERRQKGGQFGA